MAIQKLNNRVIDKHLREHAALKDKPSTRLHNDGAGLYLQITKLGSKSWIFRYRDANGTPRAKGLGPFSLVSLAMARQQAQAMRAMLYAGRDPITEAGGPRRKVVAVPTAGMTFRQVCERFFLEPKNVKRKPAWQSQFDLHAMTTLGDFPVGDISTTKILEVLRNLWVQKPETARKLQIRLNVVLGYAIDALHACPGPNPARWAALEFALPSLDDSKGESHPAMPCEQLPPFMRRLQGHRGDHVSAHVGALALEFAILTNCRTGDIIGARLVRGDDQKPPLRWRDLDLSEKVWTIPSTKSEDNFQVPLSPRAVEILKYVRAQNWSDEFVFPMFSRPHETPRAIGPCAGQTMIKVLHALAPEFHVHGFRATFRTWCDEEIVAERDVIESAMAHRVVSKDKAEAAYRRKQLLPKRRRLLEAWATYALTGKIDKDFAIPANKKPALKIVAR